jgi:hypothetical protein
MQIKLRVTPNARQERIVEERAPDGELVYKVYVTIVPEDGKANKAVIKAMAKYLGVPKSSITIIKGEAARDKVLRIDK